MTGEMKTCVLVPAHMIASIFHLVTKMENFPPSGGCPSYLPHVGLFFSTCSRISCIHTSNLLVTLQFQYFLVK